MTAPPAAAAAAPAGSSLPTPLPNNAAAAPAGSALFPPLPNNTGAPLVDVQRQHGMSAVQQQWPS